MDRPDILAQLSITIMLAAAVAAQPGALTACLARAGPLARGIGRVSSGLDRRQISYGS